MAQLDAQDLRRLLLHRDGELYWLSRPREMFADQRSFNTWNARFAGKRAFTAKHSEGYRVGRILGCSYFAHRIIWALEFGNVEVGEIDHINGNRDDNRTVNLRLVSRHENRGNVKRPITNRSGTVGVAQKGLSWEAKIQRSGKQTYLGRFPTQEEAGAVRKAAETQLGFHQNHGRA